MADIVGLPGILPQRRGVHLLTFHSVTPGSWNGILESQRLALFRRQMDFLQSHFRLIPLREALEPGQATGVKGRPPACVTFDDGFSDNYEWMFPVIQKLGIPAAIFIATDFIDRGRPPWPTRLREIVFRTACAQYPGCPEIRLHSRANRARLSVKLKDELKSLSPAERFARLDEIAKDLSVGESEYRPLTWAQARGMAAAGVEFGSHTEFHSILTEMPDHIIVKEFENSRRRIETELGRECAWLSYPNGNHDPRVREMASRAGYRAGLTQEAGLNGADCDRFAVKRIQVPPDFHVAALAVRLERVTR